MLSPSKVATLDPGQHLAVQISSTVYNPELVARYSKTAQAHRDIGQALKAVENPGPRTGKPAGQPRVHSLDRRLTPELIATIVTEYQSGTSSKQIQQHYELGKGSVLKLLREAGVTIRPPGPIPG